MAWDPYVHQIQNTFDPDTNSWKVTNVCSYAWIGGHDGTKWASTEGFELGAYEAEIMGPDLVTMVKVPCNEPAALVACAGNGGKRNGGQECGIRIANQKYMVNRQSDEGDIKCVALSKTGGGAFVAVTKQCLIVGSYLKDQPMSAGGNQNIGSVTANVLSVAKQLSEAGY